MKVRLKATQIKEQFGVSIHAPVKVRRHKLSLKATQIKVSIHAPVKVRQGQMTAREVLERFNPRTREGATLLKK